MLPIYLFAQLQGDFRWLKDDRYYFVISNPTYYDVPITYSCVNSSKNQQKTYNAIIPANGFIAIGPSTINWSWERGEIIYVTFNGQTYSFICNTTDPSGGYNPNFDGCIHGSCNIRKHECPIYRDSNGDNYCDNCAYNGYKCHINYHNCK